MADSFFGYDTSLSNLNDDEGGGEPSEDEYDALNDETFGQADGFDWELEHEQHASQLESSRRHNASMDEANDQLEASLSQLVLDDSAGCAALGSSVWRADVPLYPAQPPASSLKNLCTVEELERQMRQTQQQQYPAQNFYQPRFPPVILQRPPGLQAPVPLPFAPQNMPINPPMSQMMPNNHIMGPGNQMGQVNHPPANQNVNQFMQNANQMNFQNNLQNNMHPMHMGNMSMNHHGNHMGLGNLGQGNQLGANQMGVNQMGGNQMGANQMGGNQMGTNQMGANQMGTNQMGGNQIGQGNMVPNGNQFGPGMNQFPHMMQQRMMPPPGMPMPRQNFNPNMGQFNHNFRGPAIQQKPEPNVMMNPKPQSPPQNKTPTKLVKSRVYNNSKTQPNMTSQNLVQLIQNTHPMLQFNNSLHNANHHPMLNRYGNGQYNNMMFNQRVNGNYGNNVRHMNGDDVSSLSDTDEYGGLMTQREKQWLINIQMLQLNTGTPYIHDFYYTVFLERQSQKEKEGVKEAHKANQQNHPFYSGGVKQETHTRERHNSNRHNSTSEDAPPRAYVPTQFENSLGKLQCGSVTAPRKIIDVELVAGNEPSSARPSRASSVASTTNPAEVPREMRRTKQLLLDIEALYLILLRLEELNDPLAISNALILKEREEKQKQLELAQKEALENELEEDSNLFLRNIESVQRRPKQDSPKSENIDKRQVVNLAVNQKPVPVKNLLDENKDELVDKMFAGLLLGDRIAHMLAVRKGKALLARFLPRVAASHARLRAVWARVLRALPLAARRDDASLPALAPHYTRYIQASTGWAATLESCSLLAEALDPARTPYALTSSLTLSCVCALIEKASLLVNTPEATANERQWSKFLKTLARALKHTSLSVARPLGRMPEHKLMHHLKQLEGRSTIEILQRGKSAEFADLSKADVTEQLTKHLC